MSIQILSFSLIIGSIALLGHVYLYRRFIRDTTRSSVARLAAMAVFALLTLVLFSRRWMQSTFGDEAARASYIWMGVALFLIQALIFTDLARLAWRMFRRARLPTDAPAVLEDPQRRLFLARSLAGGALTVGGATAYYGHYRAFEPSEITEIELKIPRLPKTLDGVSIVQLTDVHVGPFVRRRFMDALVSQANALKPDLVAITGDLVDGDVRTLGPSVAALANLKSRFGSYFVTGNHEYYSGELEWVAYLESIGIDVLRNRRVAIGDGGGVFDLVGVDDWSGGMRRGRPGYDLEQAMAGRDDQRAAVLLSHQPANFPVAAGRGVDLQISGHTHGGQLFPMTKLVGLQWEYVSGHYRHADSHIYVSRGCGFWGPPMRVGSPPELVKIILTS